MGVRKFDMNYAGYEEMLGSNVSLKTTSANTAASSAAASTTTTVSTADGFGGGGGGEFDLSSAVTVVPDDTFTVQQAVNALGFGWFHIKLSLLVGLCWMADSMEMTILSILGVSLQCEWNISKYQQALTTSVVFLGMMLSSTFWTQLSDRYGRKPALTLCGVLLVLYSLLSAVAPSFAWLLLLRGLVGFSIGCVPQSVTLYAEFLPTKQRAKCVVLMDCFWALGACFEVALALAVSPNLGWRWLLGLSAAPLFIFATLAPWLPESARYHVSVGNTESAYRTLEQIARENKQPMLLGRLVMDGAPMAKGSVKSLLSPSLRRTTLLLWFIWMVCAFCYYGLVLMSTELLSYKSHTNESLVTNTASDGHFQSLETTDFMDLLWTTLAEFPGIFATIAIIERFGRKRTMALQFVLYAGCIFSLLLVEQRIYMTLVLFVGRGVIAGLFQAAYVYTPEVYPSALRSVGVGGCSALARLGAMATPYVAQVLLQTSAGSAITIYSVFGILAAFACLLLPYQNST